MVDKISTVDYSRAYIRILRITSCEVGGNLYLVDKRIDLLWRVMAFIPDNYRTLASLHLFDPSKHALVTKEDGYFVKRACYCAWEDHCREWNVEGSLHAWPKRLGKAAGSTGD